MQRTCLLVQKAQETWIRSLGGEVPTEKDQCTPILFPEKFHGEESLADCSPQGRKELEVNEHAQPYAVYKIFTLDLGTCTDWKWEMKIDIPCKWKSEESWSNKTQVRKNRLLKKIVMRQRRTLHNDQLINPSRIVKIYAANIRSTSIYKENANSHERGT